MRKDHRTSAAACRVYTLPEDAYAALVRTRENVRLLAALATPRGADFDEPALTFHALTQCFHRLADELDEVARAGWWAEQGGPADVRASPG